MSSPTQRHNLKPQGQGNHPVIGSQEYVSQPVVLSTCMPIQPA